MKARKNKLIQENLLLKAKLILKGGIFHQEREIPPEIENTFLKQVFEFEETDPMPMYQYLHIEPDDFPAEKELNDKELEEQYIRLEELLKAHNIFIEFQPGLPRRIAYRYLTEEVFYEKYVFVEGMTLHLDGCTGYCPDCFQLDYCDVKDEIWSKEEIERERKKKQSGSK